MYDNFFKNSSTLSYLYFTQFGKFFCQWFSFISKTHYFINNLYNRNERLISVFNIGKDTPKFGRQFTPEKGEPNESFQ